MYYENNDKSYIKQNKRILRSSTTKLISQRGNDNTNNTNCNTNTNRSYNSYNCNTNTNKSSNSY